MKSGMLQTVGHNALRSSCIKQIGMQRDSNRKYSSFVEETALARHIHSNTEHFHQLQTTVLTMKQQARWAFRKQYGELSMLQNMLRNSVTQTCWQSLKNVSHFVNKQTKKGVKSPRCAALGLITKYCIRKDRQVFKEKPPKCFQITQLTNLP